MITAAVFAIMPLYQVAFTARFYQRGKHTYSQVYLSDLHGGHLRQVTFDPTNKDLVRWNGPNRIEWTVDVEGSEKRPVIRAEFPDLKAKQVTPDGAVVNLDDILPPGYPGLISSGEPSAWLRWAHERFLTISGSGGDSTLRSPLGGDSLIINDGCHFQRDGYSKAVALENGFHHLVFDSVTKRTWLYSWTHNSTTGTNEWIYLFDWKTGLPDAIVGGAEDYDFQPMRETYAYTTSRDLDSIDPKRSVWTAQAYVGDWQTRKKWAIVSGMAWATSISLRPTIDWHQYMRKTVR